ncbi:hypothetical protein N1851_005272 [Merluccius polli]|uniref:Uncharacterized protein n=1 Tax=Merluccius polli TaxID=89951 RepID=A0AA47N7N5_MERPO|nr:hypothetical protein N1851_005272 [Merluccius polli]
MYWYMSLQVLKPYIISLECNLESKFKNLHILGAFSVLGPQAPTLDDVANIASRPSPGTSSLDRMPQLSKRVKQHVLSGAFKVILTTYTMQWKSTIFQEGGREIEDRYQGSGVEMHTIWLPSVGAVGLLTPRTSWQTGQRYGASRPDREQTEAESIIGVWIEDADGSM